MKKLGMFILVLALGILACTKVTPTPNALGITETPTQRATVTLEPTQTPTPTVIPALGKSPIPNALGITGNVNVRNSPNGAATGKVLLLGEGTTGTCDGNWCEIPNGWIWRGCTDDNPNALGCEAK